LREIELRIDALCEEIQRERDQVDISGALTVAEQRPFDAFGAGHKTEFRRCNRGSAVVMRVH
jgi:hypothetical protein